MILTNEIEKREPKSVWKAKCAK